MDRYRHVPIIKEIPDVLNREIVKKALIEMFEIGYRYGESSNT